MLSFFRLGTKKEASPLPQPPPVMAAHHATAKPSELKITMASQPLLQGAVLSIEPRYWSFLSTSSRPASIPPVPAASSKLALFWGKGRQEEENDDEEDDEKTIVNHASRANAPVYLRYVLVGDHRALAKASSKAISRLGHDGASCVWLGKQAAQLVVPETATRFPSRELSLVVEAFQQGAEGDKDVLLARGVVHHFMEHLHRKEAPRILVLPLVSTSPAIGSSTKKGTEKQDYQEARSEACIRLTYLPPVPPRQCRFAEMEGEVTERTLDEAKHVGIGKKDVQEQSKEEEAESKMEKKADVDCFARKIPPESENDVSAGVRQQQQQQHAPKTQSMQEERVSSVASHLHLNLAASLVEQVRQGQESKAPPLCGRMPGEEVVQPSEQEEEDKAVKVGTQAELEVEALKADVLKPILQAEVVRHGGRTAAAAAAGAVPAVAAGAAGAVPAVPAGAAGAAAAAPASSGERRRRHIRKSTASAVRRRAQLARVNRLLADLEALPTTLSVKGGMDGGRQGDVVKVKSVAEKRLATK